MSGNSALSVAVLVDLEQRQGAGGHVKCWERLAQAALDRAEAVDLTVFLSGNVEKTTELGSNVRYVTLPPVFSTRRLQMLTGPLPDHTDLAFWHPSLARRLREGRFDLLHTTDAFFAFARTAERLSSRLGLPLVNSIHTATPELTRLFADQAITKVFGTGWLGRLLKQQLALPEQLLRSKQRRLLRHQSRCAYALISQPKDAQLACQVLPTDRVRMLRRGIDHGMFSPDKRDRTWLAARFGVPETMTVALFVGRLDLSKNLSPVVEAVRQVNAAGQPLHLFCAGDGRERAGIVETLGPLTTCPGQLDIQDLARVCACSDLLVMPSEIEVLSNVVLEGLASGLPALVARKGNMGQFIELGITGEIVSDSKPSTWAKVLADLTGDPERRASMRAAVMADIAPSLPTWHQVLAEDLLPVWTAAAQRVAYSVGSRRSEMEVACR